MAKKYGVTPSKKEQDLVARLIAKWGITMVARDLEVGEASVARIAAGAPVLSATLDKAMGHISRDAEDKELRLATVRAIVERLRAFADPSLAGYGAISVAADLVEREFGK